MKSAQQASSSSMLAYATSFSATAFHRAAPAASVLQANESVPIDGRKSFFTISATDQLDLDRTQLGYRWRPPSTHRTTRLLQSDVDILGDDDRRFVDRLGESVPGLPTVIDLAGRLTRLLRRQSTESLAAWFLDAAATPLARVAATLHRYIDTLAAAIDTPWTASPVEGQFSRLKIIKRTMYGRAGFNLLRVRVMASG